MDHHQLIPVASSTINNEVTPTVNARDLHQFLQVGKDFSNWIKAQIERARLVEDRDFVTVAQKGVGGKFGTIDYHLTIESGKHVAMMSGTDKGFEVREYFIECERRAKQQHQIPTTLSEALYLAAKQAEQIECQQKQIADMEPKAAFFDAVTESPDAIDMANVAKVLAVPGLGRNTLFLILRNLGILQQNNQPYQTHVDNGNFRIIEQKYTKRDGSTHINLKTVVYQKGLDYIRRIIAHNMKGGEWTAPARWVLPGQKRQALPA